MQNLFWGEGKKNVLWVMRMYKVKRNHVLTIHWLHVALSQGITSDMSEVIIQLGLVCYCLDISIPTHPSSFYYTIMGCQIILVLDSRY